MPIYEWVCRSEDCRLTITTTLYSQTLQCPRCNSGMRRLYSFTVNLPMPEHFNDTTGTYVTNERAFNDDLKRLSEEQTARTGIYHNYVPTDPTDRSSVGVTTEGLDATYDRANPVARKALEKYV